MSDFVNLLDFESIIRSYIETSVLEYEPDMDVSKNSTFDDLFIKPMVASLLPFINQINKLEFKSNMANRQFLTDEELDEVGENNYFTERKMGDYATAVLTLYFSNIPSENYPITISAGTVFYTENGVEFQTRGVITITREALSKNYNSSNFSYEYDIDVYAVNKGTDYNVTAGEISSCRNFISNYYIGCSNKNEASGGTEAETNDEYWERIQKIFTSRQFGTNEGYKAFIREVLPDIDDIYIAGYKNPYMQRDIYTVVKSSDPLITESVHLGGKVDIYLKGCAYNQTYDIIESKSPNVLLEDNTEDIDMSSLKVYINGEDCSESDYFEKITSEDEKFKGRCVLSFKTYKDEDVVDIMQRGESLTILVNYRTNSDSYKTKSTTIEVCSKTIDFNPVKTIDYFMYNDEVIELENCSVGPENEGEGEVFNPNSYQYTYEGESNTTESVLNIKVFSVDTYNGESIYMYYTYNESLFLVEKYLNGKLSISGEEHRPITADVRALEALEASVSISFKYKIYDKYEGIDTSYVESKLKSSIVAYLENKKLGENISQNDLAGYIYTDKSVNSLIQYIILPFDKFEITGKENVDENGKSVNELNIEDIEYPVLDLNNLNLTAL